jgi:glycine/serine hydroxymethyltransferase
LCEWRESAGQIVRVFAAHDAAATLAAVRAEVQEMCGRFPLYTEWAKA